MTPEERLSIVGEYKHGSIKRIKLKNFLTYFDAEVTPGPRLNMVIGPNGTGKSTILCAICLGLGGEPRLLGRASEIETFVANGEEEGEIELELVNTQGGPNPIIRREIRRQGKPKSLFYWDGHASSAKAVREKCLTEYNITVDNLCTFLPQDRVGSFSGFDSKQLLIETEKSLNANQNLYHTHQDLIEQQEKMKGGGNQKGTLEDKLQQLQAEHKRLGRAKELMEERDTAVKQSELLRKKLLWLEFDALVEATNLKKAAKADLKQKHAEVKATIQPLEQEYNKARMELDRLTEDTNRYDAEIRVHQKEMERQIKKYENHDDQIETICQDLYALDATRGAKERKAEDLRQKVQEYRKQMEGLPSLQSLKEEEFQCRNDAKAAMPEYENAKREHGRLVQESREVEDEVKRAQTKMHKLQDEKSRRNERIFRQQPHLKTISEWLQGNRTRFRKPVVGPIMCEIATKNHQTASYLEQHVPNATLKSFVVQCNEDYDLLYRSIREEKGVPINVLMIRDIKPVHRIYSEEKMAILKRDHGVLGYMDDTFEAPPVVMAALRSSAQIEKVLIGGDKTQHSLDNKGLLEFLAQPEGGGGNHHDKLQSSCIFSSQGADKHFKYTSIISKYSGKASHRIDNVRPAKWLAPGVSEDTKQRTKAELDEVVQRHESLQPAIQKAEQELAETQEKAQAARAKVTEARDNLKDLQRYENKAKSSEAKLREAEKELEVSNDDEKEKLMGLLNKRVHHSLQALEAHSDSYLKMMKATVKCSGLRLNKAAVESEEKRLSVGYHDAMEELRTTEIEYKNAVAGFKESMRKAVAAKNRADEEAPLMDENKNELPLKAELEGLGVETLDEALCALDEAEAKVQNIHADHNAIREFERNQAEMDEVQEQLDDLDGREKRQRAELDEKVGPWEEKLSNAVRDVDTLFGKYMAEMGCTGEVQLTKGTPTEEMPYGNFKDWGIEIRVSFRENHKLQVLSARVQSGGERSVSTIMYLMALQGMMVAPFRCVDEINQGLDERNERLVFKRIVSNSTLVPGEKGLTDHAGQYFLITPKLLPNLYDMEVEAMTVLFIFNGTHNVKKPNDFDISRLLALRKRALIESVAAEDDENTPNSQSSDTRPGKVRRRSLATIDTPQVAIEEEA